MGAIWATFQRFWEPQGQLNEDDRTKIMQATLKAWREEKIYVTKSVSATRRKIMSQNCVCVVGLPGSGKSTALRHAALPLENEGFTIYVIDGSKDYLDYYDEDKRQVFILDDVLGVYSTNESEIDFWVKYNDRIKNGLGSNTKLILSIRTQLYNEAVKGNSFIFLDKSTCIDICDETYKLSTADMKSMLKHCLAVQGRGISDGLLNSIFSDYTEEQLQGMLEKRRTIVMSKETAWQTVSHCFPLLCKIYCSEDLEIVTPRTFFRYPFEAFTKNFEKMKSDNKHQFCGLVLCSVFNGKLTEYMFSIQCELDNELDEKSLELRNIIMKSCGLEGNENLPKIKSALHFLDGVYVSHKDNSYQMLHVVFHEVVTYVFNDADPSFVITYGTSYLIRDRIRLNKTQPKNDQYIITISDDKYIKRLADRLISDLKFDAYTGVEFIVSNPNIDDDRLISCLKSIVKPVLKDPMGQTISEIQQIDQKLIDQLFHQCMKTVFGTSAFKDSDLIQYKLIELCLNAGADSNMHIGVLLGMDPLFISVMTGCLKLTKLLLDNGADIRRINHDEMTILHWVGKNSMYNKLELIKLLTQNREQYVVEFISRDRRRILEEVQFDDFRKQHFSHIDLCVYNLQLEEVLSDNSIRILTTDSNEMTRYVECFTGKLQLVKCLHDNILTYENRSTGQNILHYVADDIAVTRYLFSLPNIKEAISHRDKGGRTPLSEVQRVYLFREEVNRNREDMIQLYRDNVENIT